MHVWQRDRRAHDSGQRRHVRDLLDCGQEAAHTRTALRALELLEHHLLQNAVDVEASGNLDGGTAAGGTAGAEDTEADLMSAQQEQRDGAQSGGATIGQRIAIRVWMCTFMFGTNPI